MNIHIYMYIHTYIYIYIYILAAEDLPERRIDAVDLAEHLAGAAIAEQRRRARRDAWTAEGLVLFVYVSAVYLFVLNRSIGYEYVLFVLYLASGRYPHLDLMNGISDTP